MVGSHLWIACYSLHFAKTDDIELKSSVGGKEGISFSTGSTLAQGCWQNSRKCSGLGPPGRMVKFNGEAVTDKV